MHKKLRSPSPATVIALVALFVSLGGTTWAVTQIGSRQVKNNSLRGIDLRNNDVRGKDVRNKSLTSMDIKDGTLTSEDVQSAANSDRLDNLDSTDFLRSSRQVNLFNKIAAGGSATVFEGQGLTVTASCSANAATITLTGTSSKDNSSFSGVGATDYNFDNGDSTSQSYTDIMSTGDYEQEIRVQFANADGASVTLLTWAAYSSAALGGTTACLVSGTGLVNS